MEHPKFIITMDGFLRLGMVNQHKELLIGNDQCIGEGYYQFDWTCNPLSWIVHRMISDGHAGTCSIH